MFISLQQLRRNHHRGMTLVELMIVVAIIGVLASVAGVAFFRQIKRSKIAKDESVAMSVKRGQEEFRSNQGTYFPPPPDNGVAVVQADRTADAATQKRWTNFLNVKLDELPPDVTIHVLSGDAGAACAGGPAGICNGVNTTSSWFAVAVEHNLDPGKPLNTLVVTSSTNNNTIIINEGQ